jgi:hypothetical protein
VCLSGAAISAISARTARTDGMDDLGHEKPNPVSSFKFQVSTAMMRSSVAQTDVWNRRFEVRGSSVDAHKYSKTDNADTSRATLR